MEEGSKSAWEGQNEHLVGVEGGRESAWESQSEHLVGVEEELNPPEKAKVSI